MSLRCPEDLCVDRPPVRKLLWTVTGYALALIAANYLLPVDWLPPCALIALVLGLGALAFRRRAWGKRALLALFAAAVGFLWTWGYTQLFYEPADAFAGQTRSLTVLVTDYPEEYSDSTRIYVRSQDREVPHVRMQVVDYDRGMTELRPGDLVELNMKLLSAGQRAGAKTDAYRSSGILLRGYRKGDYLCLGRYSMSWLFAPKELSRLLQEETLRCFPADVSGLMKALLTGNRTEYYLDEELNAAMRGAGFTHVIAVSGLHVAFLVGFVRLLTGRRRASAFVGIPTVLVFMAMIGFTPSVNRAGIMQIMLLLAPLFQRENDPPSALALALGLLLLINPYSIGSAGLQFSFAATVGLILLSPAVDRRLTRRQDGALRVRGVLARPYRALAAALSAGLGASIFTAPLSALHFGYVPLYGLLSNLLCLWLISAAFYLGYAVCALGLIWAPLGLGAGWAVAWLPRVVRWVVEHIARWPNALLYTEDDLAVWWLVLVYSVFLLFWLLRDQKEPFRPLIPLCISLIGFCAVTFAQGLNRPETCLLSALDVGQGQCVVAMTRDFTLMVDCGGDAGNAGDTAAAYLSKHGQRRVDLLVLTHFDSDHVNGVRRLLSQVEVRRLAIAAEYPGSSLSSSLLSACGRSGVELFAVDRDTSFTSDGLKVQLFAPMGSGDENDEGLIVYGDWGDWEFLITGDAGFEVEEHLVRSYQLGDIEVLVAGHHGSRSSTGEVLLDAVTPETVLISCGADNRYGHPTEAVLERLAKRGIAVRRTDLEGTVTVTAPAEMRMG